MNMIATADWAGELSRQLLAPLGNRWQHVQGVVRRAQAVAALFNQENGDNLISAAYLHDIGYAPSLVVTGFHPLDGARYLRSLGYERLALLVAYHSESQFEAALRGYATELAAFSRERSAVADALTYCDQLTNSVGEAVSLRERHADIRARYAADSVVARSCRQALPYLALAVGRTKRRLALRGISG